jgi:alanine-synthesizing transaminase
VRYLTPALHALQYLWFVRLLKTNESRERERALLGSARARVGWLVFSGEREHARDFIDAVEMLASLRLCSNVPGQYAVQTALGGYQSIFDLTRPGGRLHATRQAVLEAVGRSKYLSVVPPRGAMYGFIRVHAERLPGGAAAFDDQAFALDLLQRKHVLVAPGSSFNVPYRDHFRVTLLPDADEIAAIIAFADDEEVMEENDAPPPVQEPAEILPPAPLAEAEPEPAIEAIAEPEPEARVTFRIIGRGLRPRSPPAAATSTA